MRLIRWRTSNIIVILELAIATVFIAAVLESSVIPLVPSDLLLLPVLSYPEHAFLFIGVATTGSTLGSLGGLWIGRNKGEKFMRRFISQARFTWSEQVYEKHGKFALFLSAIGPIPFTIFTITSGVFDLDYKSMSIIAFFGRGMKFTVEVLALVWISHFPTTIAMGILAVGLVVGYLGWNFFLEKKIETWLAR